MDERREIHHRANMSIGPKMVKAMRLIFDANHPSQTSVLEENGIFIKRDDILKE